MRYTGYKRFTVGHSWLLELNVVSLRPIAIVPATPSTLDGLCGTEQRNGANSIFQLCWRLEVKGDPGEARDARPPSTVVRLI